jgi:hypothetical protein
MSTHVEFKVFRDIDHPRHPNGRFARLGSIAVGDLRLANIADGHAKDNEIERFEARDQTGRLLGSVHRDGDVNGPWVSRAYHGETETHTTRDRAAGALAAASVVRGAPFHSAHLRPGDRFRVVDGPDRSFTLAEGWVHRGGDTSLRVDEDAVVKLGNDVRVVLA